MQLNDVIFTVDSHVKIELEVVTGILFFTITVLLLFYSLAPESPRYLCVKGNTTDAHRILEKIAQLNKKKLPSGLLVSTITDRQDEEFAPKEDVPLLSSTRKNTEEKKNCLSPVFMLFSSNLT